MNTRGLALTLRRHIPVHIKRVTPNPMIQDDMKRFDLGQLMTNKLMALAQESEAFLQNFEDEMHATGQTLDPRPMGNHYTTPLLAPRAQRPMEDRLRHEAREVRDRLGLRADPPMVDKGDATFARS